MSKQYIELGDRVISTEVVHASPTRGRLVVAVESGPPLTREECDRLVAAAFVEAARCGLGLLGWEEW